MSTSLQIDSTSTSSVCVLHVAGEVDLANERQLETAIASALDSGSVVVDLHDVPFFAIGGLAVLLRCRRRGLVRGHVLIVAAPRPQLQRLLHVARLTGAVPCVRSVTAGCALAEHIERARNPRSRSPQPHDTIA